MKIARDGHVYRADADMEILKMNGGMIKANLVGINAASTFLGFCQGHDTATFAPLELADIEPTAEQAFLLVYRPFVKELYQKERVRETLELVLNKKKLHRMMRDYGAAYRRGTVHAIKELREYKSALDKQLLAGDFSGIRYCTIHLDRVPDVMCSGVVHPTETFAGDPLQNLADLGRVPRFVSFSLIATQDAGAAVFAWPVECDPVVAPLVDSLLQIPWDGIPAALVRYAFSEFENVFFRPEWWDGLQTPIRAALERRMLDNVGTHEAPPRYLRDDGVRVVAWRVTRIELNGRALAEDG